MAGSLFWEGNKMDPQDLCQELRVYIKKDPIAEVHYAQTSVGSAPESFVGLALPRANKDIVVFRFHYYRVYSSSLRGFWPPCCC
jgi:hypothetical protein